jgi:uncharacterized membrane protein YsdA (DUF1294 family)
MKMDPHTHRKRPVLFHFALGIALALAFAIGVWFALSRHVDGPHLVGCWLLAINVVTFGYYGYDKGRARSAGSRVPEVVLHGLSASGGSPGAFAGMHLFRHKTVKKSFRILFWCIVALQVALAAWIARLVWWS